MNPFNHSRADRTIRLPKAIGMLAVAGLGFMSLGSACADPNLLINGSFEEAAADFDFGSNDSTILDPGSQAILGWTTFQDKIVWGGSPDALGTASDGPGFVELASVGSGGGGLSQHVATLAGQSYRLSFDLGSPYVFWTGVGIGVETGSSSAFEYLVFEDTNRPGGEKYQHFTFDYVAIGASDIRFSQSGSSLPIDLDNVALTAITPAVPEPSSWAVLAAGISVIGMVGRRRAMATKRLAK